MPLFGRGRAPKYVRLGTTAVTRVILGERVVFDGTTPAVAALPRASAAAAAVVPDIAAGATLTLPTATAVSEARLPAIRASGGILMPPAQATAAAALPEVSAGAEVQLPTAAAVTNADPPAIQVVMEGEVLLPRAAATATAFAPSVTVVAEVFLPTATAVGEARVPAVVGGAVVSLPVAAASAAAAVPTITAGGAIALPRAQATAAALLPIVGGGGAVTLPTATASAAALAPAASAGAYFTDNFNRTDNTSLGANWTETGGDLGIASNMLAVQGTSNSRRAAIYNTPTATPYQFVEFTMGTAPTTGAGSGAVLRSNAGFTQMFMLSVASNGWSLNRITGINGTITALGNLSATISIGTTVRVQVDANNVWSVYLNGVKSGNSFLDATWADSSHQYLGLFVQRTGSGTGISASLDNFAGGDTASYVQFAADNFNRSLIGSDWTLRFGPLYLASNELCSVGNASEPISYGWYNATSPTADQACEAKIRWNGRNPLHSSVSVAVRADPATSHGGVHYWRVADKHGICMYNWAGDSFTAATGTADFPTTTKAAEGAVMRIEARGTVYTAFLDGVFQLQGTFTTTQVPLTNRYCGVHGEDDSGVSGGGDPPANLDDWAAYSIP